MNADFTKVSFNVMLHGFLTILLMNSLACHLANNSFAFCVNGKADREVHRVEVLWSLMQLFESGDAKASPNVANSR
jgi:hypothetical protein